jgi:hypothetical protein
LERDELLRRPLVAVFAVARPDGRVHATPLWYLWDGHAFHLIVERGSPRHRWSVASGRAAICIESTVGRDLNFVTAEGTVTVVDPLTKEARLRMWEHYRGADRARRVVERGGHETKVGLVLTPETWIPA